MTNTSQTRNDLAKLFTGTGVEVGTEQGEFAEVICQTADKLYCVDKWQAYRGYRDHTRNGKLQTFYETTVARLAPYNVELLRMSSEQAVHRFEDESLDFVYIDANHALEYAFWDIISWTRKVRPGGIVAGHDYARREGQDRYYDVVGAVQLYTKYRNLEYVIWNGDEVPSWSFIA